MCQSIEQVRLEKKRMIVEKSEREPIGDYWIKRSTIDYSPKEYNFKVYFNMDCLFQYLRFEEYPEVQAEILKDKRSSTKVAAIAKKYENQFALKQNPEKDIEIMRFCIKEALEYAKTRKYSRVIYKLMATEGLNIIVASRTDTFWGMKKDKGGNYVGNNYLGVLWMEFRDELMKSNPVRLSFNECEWEEDEQYKESDYIILHLLDSNQEIKFSEIYGIPKVSSYFAGLGYELLYQQSSRIRDYRAFKEFFYENYECLFANLIEQVLAGKQEASVALEAELKFWIGDWLKSTVSYSDHVKGRGICRLNELLFYGKDTIYFDEDYSFN